MTAKMIRQAMENASQCGAMAIMKQAQEHPGLSTEAKEAIRLTQLEWERSKAFEELSPHCVSPELVWDTCLHLMQNGRVIPFRGEAA